MITFYQNALHLTRLHCATFNQSALRHEELEDLVCWQPVFSPGSLGRETSPLIITREKQTVSSLRGSDDGCHTTEPSSLYAWILVVMFCSGLAVKLGYLKDSNAAAHSVTAPAWNIWGIDCDILILKLLIHFLAVSPPVVECVKWREIIITKACRVI